VTDATDDDRHRRRRLLLRVASAGAALALVVVLGVVVLAGQNHTTRSSAAFCRRIADVSALSDALASGDGSQIRSATDRLRRAEQVAPTEIAPQMQTLVAYADGLDRTIATASGDPGAVDAALADAVRAQQGQNADVETAGNVVKYYTKATCDLNLVNGTTPATTP
jgi:hypothetical protein